MKLIIITYIITWSLIIFFNILTAIRWCYNEELEQRFTSKSNKKYNKLTTIKDVFLTLCPIVNIITLVIYIPMAFCSEDVIDKVLKFYEHYMLGVDSN